MNILESASKIVFIAMTFTLCIVFIFEVVAGRITMDPKDFVALTMMAFTFYFANKGDDNKPFAGK